MGFFGAEYLKKTNWREEAVSIALWISLNMADLIETIVGMIVMDGGFVEANPIAVRIGENFVALVGYKLALTLLATVLLSYLQRLHLLKWCNIVMAMVVVWNLGWLLYILN